MPRNKKRKNHSTSSASPQESDSCVTPKTPREMSNTCSTGELVRQSLDTIYAADSQPMPDPQVEHPQVLTILAEINKKLNKLDTIETELGYIKYKLAHLEAKVQDIDKVKVRVDDIEESVTYMNTCFEEWKTDKGKLHAEMAEVKCNMAAITSKVDQLQLENVHLTEAAVDARCRSMHDNLIFTNIPETEKMSTLQECEKALKAFIHTGLHVDCTDIRFKRVHRIGRPSKDPARPRSMIGKFIYTEHRDTVLKAAKLLKGKPYSIFEQLPPEVSDYRKQVLLPKLREARSKNIPDRINIDKLYINNVEQTVDPPLTVYRGVLSHNADDSDTKVDMNFMIRTV